MLTSEQQKIYNVKVPKGGYGYYTLFHGIYDPENDIDERPAYAQTGDLFEPEGSSVVYKATRKNGKTTWAIAEDAQRQSESGESGSGGGGAEKFIVTLTQDEQTKVWTSDKMIAEIVAADEANMVVVCKLAFEETPVVIEIPMNGTTDGAVIFGGASKDLTDLGANSVYTAIGIEEEGKVGWSVITTPIPSSNAPLIVTMTVDESTGNIVGDKTFGEVYTAVSTGKTVYISAMGNYAILNSCELESGTYTIVGAAEGMTFEGTENDYLTITGG